MRFSEAAEGRRRNIPPRTAVLEPSDWSSEWNQRPGHSIAVGIRRLSEAAVQGSAAEAKRATLRTLVVDRLDDDDQDHVRAYNGALMAIAVGRAICDPNDLTKPAPELTMAEDQVQFALTPSAIKRLFHEVELTTILNSPAYRTATNEEVSELAALLGPDWDAGMRYESAQSVRRLLAHCLDEIEAARS